MSCCRRKVSASPKLRGDTWHCGIYIYIWISSTITADFPFAQSGIIGIYFTAPRLNFLCRALWTSCPSNHYTHAAILKSMPACPSISFSGPFSSATTTSEPNNTHTLLSTVIGGIVIAVFAFVNLIGSVLLFVLWRKRRPPRRRISEDMAAHELPYDGRVSELSCDGMVFELPAVLPWEAAKNMLDGSNRFKSDSDRVFPDERVDKRCSSSSGHCNGQWDPQYEKKNISVELHGSEVATFELPGNQTSQQLFEPSSRRSSALSKSVDYSGVEVNQEHYTNKSATSRTSCHNVFSPLGHTPVVSPILGLSSPLSDFGHAFRSPVQCDFNMTEPITPPESKKLARQDGLRQNTHRNYSFPRSDPQHGRDFSVAEHNGPECRSAQHGAPIGYDTFIQSSTSMLQDPQTPVRRSACFGESTSWSSPQDLSYALSVAHKPKRARRSSRIVDRGNYPAEDLSLNMTHMWPSPDLPCLPMNQSTPFTPAYNRVGGFPTLLGGESEPASGYSWSPSEDLLTTHTSTTITTPISSLISPKVEVEVAW